MLMRTGGLVLHTTNYSETSVIAKVFTQQLGLRSYIMKGVRSRGGRTKANLLQPMTHVELVVYNNPKTSLNYIKEIAPSGCRGAYDYDPVVTTLRFFMAELLYKSLREEEPLPALFDYCVEFIGLCDSASQRGNGENAQETARKVLPMSSLPIMFELGVLHHLGLEPMNNYSGQEPYFNLKEGRYMGAPSRYSPREATEGDYMLDGTGSLHLHYYLEVMQHEGAVPLLAQWQRRQLIETLLEYYRIHIADFRNFKSHEILHAVLS